MSDLDWSCLDTGHVECCWVVEPLLDGFVVTSNIAAKGSNEGDWEDKTTPLCTNLRSFGEAVDLWFSKRIAPSWVDSPWVGDVDVGTHV